MKNFLLALFILCCQFSYPAALTSNTCVADLFGDAKQSNFYRELVRDNLQMMNYGLRHIPTMITYKSGGPKAVVECLEGNYEDVTILAHSQSQRVLYKKGRTGLRTKTNDKYRNIAQLKYGFTKLVNGKEIFITEPLSPNVFRIFLKKNNHKILNKRIRQITLIFCSAEGFLASENSKELRALVEENDLHLKIAPIDNLSMPHLRTYFLNNYESSSEMIDKFESFDDFYKTLKQHFNKKGYRSSFTSSLLIAENAQDANHDRLYCLASYRYGFWGRSKNKFSQSCLRNHFSLKITGRSSLFSKNILHKMFSFSYNDQRNEVVDINLWSEAIENQSTYGRGKESSIEVTLTKK